jgi:hypothetical protein
LQPRAGNGCETATLGRHMPNLAWQRLRFGCRLGRAGLGCSLAGRLPQPMVD